MVKRINYVKIKHHFSFAVPAFVSVAQLMFVISTGDSLFLAMNRSGEISTYEEIPRLRSSSFTRNDKIFSCATNTKVGVAQLTKETLK